MSIQENHCLVASCATKRFAPTMRQFNVHNVAIHKYECYQHTVSYCSPAKKYGNIIGCWKGYLFIKNFNFSIYFAFKMSETIEDNGACHCRSVKYKINGTMIMSALCHCKACCHNRGMSPVHLIGVSPPEAIEITEGKEMLTKAKGYGKMIHAFCSKCGTMIYQCPGEDAPFRAVLPTNFHIEDGVNCKLPEKYLPKIHVNYENRQYDSCDKLPKFKCFPPNGMLDNQGNEMAS